ncbi:hypothetical protein HJG60_010971 [Phyllostomus discolor]|uniref:Uncharacterized protein n=1 Tax=Phyllostomus discolor TaxID=89673 RepID=A0A834AEZ1_9CHIR|nr:hypothetical protein HJG60_010971 [Phyllostomus discolor]
MMSYICAVPDRLQSTLSYYPVHSVDSSAKWGRVREEGVGGGGESSDTATLQARPSCFTPESLLPPLQSRIWEHLPPEALGVCSENLHGRCLAHLGTQELLVHILQMRNLELREIAAFCGLLLNLRCSHPSRLRTTIFVELTCLKVAQLLEGRARTPTQDIGLQSLSHKQHTVWERSPQLIKTDLHTPFADDQNYRCFVEKPRITRQWYSL